MAGKNFFLVLALVTLLSFLPGIVIADIDVLPKTGVPTLARWVSAPVHHKRTDPNACNADNCLRALRRFSTSAVPFCSSFLHIPKSTVTSTVTTTTMPGYTVSQTTSVETTTTSTITVLATTVTTTTTTTIPTFTATSQPAKRSERDSDDAKKGKDNAPKKKEDDDRDRDDKDNETLPSYVSQYPTARISSACSCLSITPSTTTVTSTSTVTSPTPATTVVQTKTNTITAATTTTGTVTSTSTVTVTGCPAPAIVPGAYGVGTISVGGMQSGTILFPNTQNAVDCCLACYDPSRSHNCVLFAGGPGFCFLIVDSGGPNPSPVCPAGLGGGNLYAGPTEPQDQIGGAGPCAGTGFSIITS